MGRKIKILWSSSSFCLSFENQQSLICSKLAFSRRPENFKSAATPWPSWLIFTKEETSPMCLYCINPVPQVISKIREVKVESSLILIPLKILSHTLPHWKVPSSGKYESRGLRCSRTYNIY